MLWYIENTISVSFNIKFIRRDQKQRRNGEACRASPTCIWSSLINLISKTLTWFSIYHALSADLMAKESEKNENQMQYCSILLTSRMRYEVNR